MRQILQSTAKRRDFRAVFLHRSRKLLDFRCSLRGLLFKLGDLSLILRLFAHLGLQHGELVLQREIRSVELADLRDDLLVVRAKRLLLVRADLEVVFDAARVADVQPLDSIAFADTSTSHRARLPTRFGSAPRAPALDARCS